METVGMVGFASLFRWESEQASGGERAICSRRWRVHQRAVRGALTNKIFFFFLFISFDYSIFWEEEDGRAPDWTRLGKECKIFHGAFRRRTRGRGKTVL